MTDCKKIKMIATDIDGVLSDGKIYYSSNGEEIKSFFAQDGLGFTIAKKLGYIIVIITGRTSSIVERRANELGFDYTIMGCHNKLSMLQQICEKEKISLAEVAYIGDDLNDLAVLLSVGFSAAPKNAVKDVKDRVQVVASRNGGEGAAREIVEYIIRESGRWNEVLQVFQEGMYEVHQ